MLDPKNGKDTLIISYPKIFNPLMVCDLKQTKIWSACSQKKKKNSWAWITAYILFHPQTISFGKVATKNRQWQQMALSREHLFPTPTLILRAEDAGPAWSSQVATKELEVTGTRRLYYWNTGKLYHHAGKFCIFWNIGTGVMLAH